MASTQMAWVRGAVGYACRVGLNQAHAAVQRRVVRSRSCQRGAAAFPGLVGPARAGGLPAVFARTLCAPSKGGAERPQGRSRGKIVEMLRKGGKGNTRYGFIQTDHGERVYFKEAYLTNASWEDIQADDDVEFHLKEMEPGKVQALNVRVLVGSAAGGGGSLFPEGRITGDVDAWLGKFGYVTVAPGLPPIYISQEDIRTPGRSGRTGRLEVGEIVEFEVEENDLEIMDSESVITDPRQQFMGKSVLVVGSRRDQAAAMDFVAGGHQGGAGSEPPSVPVKSYMDAGLSIAGHATHTADPYATILWRAPVNAARAQADGPTQKQKQKQKGGIRGTVGRLVATDAAGTQRVIHGSDGAQYLVDEASDGGVLDAGFKLLVQGLAVEFEGAGGEVTAGSGSETFGVAAKVRVDFDVDAAGLDADDWVVRRQHYNKTLEQLRRRYASQHQTAMHYLKELQDGREAETRARKERRVAAKQENQALMATWVQRVQEVESEERAKRVQQKDENRRRTEALRSEALRTVVQSQQASSLAFIAEDSADKGHLDAMLLAQVQQEVNHNRGNHH